MAGSHAPPTVRRGPTRRTTLASGLVLLGVAGGGYLLFGGSDERRILSSLRELGAAASSLPAESDRERGRRLRAALARLTLPSVTLSVPELGTFEGWDEILGAFALADGYGLRVGIEQSEVRVRQNRADATLLVSLVAKVPGEERRQKRTLSVELKRTGARFLVASIAVSSSVDEPPEARP